MNAFLEQFSRELPADVHAAACSTDPGSCRLARCRRLASTGEHHADPPAAQESGTNPVENLWHYLRSHYWSNRLYKTWDDLKSAATKAWRNVCLVPEVVRSVCADTAMRAI